MPAWILVLVISIPGPVDLGEIKAGFFGPAECLRAARNHHAEDELMCLEFEL